MSSHHSSVLKNPGSFQIAPGLKNLFILFSLIGLVTFAVGLYGSADRTWFSFVHNHFFFMSLSLGGLFFAALQWLTGAMWSSPIRRLGEALTAYLPIAFISCIVLYFGIHHLYHWSHPEVVKGDLILEGKASYLNVSFFMIRNLLAIGLWIFFAYRIVGNSIAQDKNGDLKYTHKNQFLAPIFMILFALSYTMVSFDQMMSLDAHWFSTIFGLYCFAGLFYSVLAAVCVLAVLLKRQGALEGIVNENHLHDLAKFMFAFTVFWAYIGFSQFMLIWYANLPEETGYFALRMSQKWYNISMFLLVGKFLVPFFFLIRRAAKRNENRILWVGVFMLFAQWIDILWIVQPELYSEGPRVGLLEIGITLGFLGVFGLSVSKFLGRFNIVAIGDPRLKEAVFKHHQ